MKQPSSDRATSKPFKNSFHPRVALPSHLLVHLENEEATSMPERITSALKLKKMPGLSLVWMSLIALFFLIASKANAQNAPHLPGWVVLPVEEYRMLHARAYPTEGDPEPPPVEATLTRVDYDLRINGDLAAGRATITVDVLKDGWVRVPIPSGLLVREARLEGKLVSLVPSAAGKSGSQLSALLSHPGRAILLLDIALPVAISAGEESISLPSTASGVSRAAVQLPRQGVDLKLTGGLVSEKSESATESKWIAYGRGNEPLTFTWRRKTEDHRTTQPLRLRGSLTQLLGLGEDATSINAEVNLEVTQGAAHEVRIEIPEKVTINQVLGAVVADWEVKSGQLSVTFLEPVEQRARFVITGETRSPREGQIEVPILRLVDTERETGGVAVEVLGAGEIKDVKSEGLESADATDLGEMVASRQSQSLTAFRFRSSAAKLARSLTVEVARYTPQAVLLANVEEARYQVLISSEGKILVQARYAIRNNQRNFLKISLPPGATLWSASLAGKAVRPGQSPDGSLLLPLDKARSGEEAPEFAVEVVYLARGNAWNDKGQFRLVMPALDLPVSRTGLLVYHPPMFKVIPEQGAFRMETYANPSSAALNPPAAFGSGAGGVSAGISGGASAIASSGPAAMREMAAAPLSPFDVDGKDEVKAKQAQAATQSLLDKFRADALAGKRAGILPIRVSFPVFGPSLYLVSELTGENQAPIANLTYQHDKKAGGK
jgi:hypothetical protein